MNEKSDYWLLDISDTDKLESGVNRLMNEEGYEPLGGVSVYVEDGKVHYVQALVKRKLEPRPNRSKK